MPDEIVKSFLEQLMESIGGLSDAICLLLQHYHVSAAEKEFEHKNENINQHHTGR